MSPIRPSAMLPAPPILPSAASHATGFIGKRTFQPPAARITTATRLAGRRAFGTSYTITGRAEFRISCKPVAQT
jgi:hypothetical protein